MSLPLAASTVTVVLLILSNVAVANFDCGANNADNDNARRDDDDDHHTRFSSSFCSMTATSSASSPTTSTIVVHDGVSKGTVAGIAIGVVLGVLALLALLICCWIRYRRHRTLGSRSNADALAALAVEKMPAPTPHSSNTDPDRTHLLNTAPNVHPSLRPGSVYNHSLPSLSMFPAYETSRDVPYSRAMVTEREAILPIMPTTTSAPTTTMRNIGTRRSASISSLPNPHSTQPSISGHPDADIERELPPLPPSPISPVSPSSNDHNYPAQSLSYASPLSQTADLSRSHTRRTSTSSGIGLAPRSSLHEEMAVYQKRLEVHHEKQMLDAQGGSSAGLPVDPPPVYREADEDQQQPEGETS